MRVLMISWEYPPNIVGGLGKHVEELLPALLEQGAEVHLVTPLAKGGAEFEKVYDGFTVQRVELPASTAAGFFADVATSNKLLADRLVDAASRFGPFDLIHAHDWLVGEAAMSAANTTGLPLVSTIHATEWGRARGALNTDLQRAIHQEEYSLAQRSSRVIACSDYMAEEISNIFEIPRQKVTVIPNGIDTARFDALAGHDFSALRAGFALPHERLVFAVGRVVYEKGFQVLIDAAPYVLTSMPETKFVLAGKGPMLDELRLRVQENDLGDKFHVAGFVSDETRDGLLMACDVAVFPSLYEPFGIVALEGMAARAPVVVSNVGGLQEVVEHGETGIITYAGDPASLAWGILHTLQHPQWAVARANNAYQTVLTKFNWFTIAGQTAQVYTSVLAEVGRATP